MKYTKENIIGLSFHIGNPIRHWQIEGISDTTVYYTYHDPSSSANGMKGETDLEDLLENLNSGKWKILSAEYEIY